MHERVSSGSVCRVSTLRVGLDAGSTTVKLVVMDGETSVLRDYRRHHADVQGEVSRLLELLADTCPGAEARLAVTGSAGLGVAEKLELPFVQEVIAGAEATTRLIPGADVAIELGGEDAKITYLKPSPEQRMNGTCAGGTGAFIDQMASLMRTDAAGLDALAAGFEHLYPIASRCGVFAKSDLQPLINEGARLEDLAASIFQAVAVQTISGLACGRPLRGHIALLGGPLYFLPQLRAAFERVLKPSGCTFVVPERAQLFVATGAALLADGEKTSVTELARRVRRSSGAFVETVRMRPLFADDGERQAFDDRHRVKIPRSLLATAEGSCFLGIDAGSTTIKAVLTDAEDRILFSRYANNEGDPLAAAVGILRDVRRGLPASAVIARACVTGYGEGLISAALGIGDGVVETMAHYRAASRIAPGVTSVIDIGGQDMKYLRIRDGAIDEITVNEACSSGCGSFLQTSAESLGLDLGEFCKLAVGSTSPVDLGSRCTVFMNSSVKQAQREGASAADIAAGLSYAVVRNALYKVIKLVDPHQLGDVVVVQGGTFLNDAVLRAFELLTGREVIRPDAAGLMGAYGAALVAGDRFEESGPSPVKSSETLERMRVDTELAVCGLCQNRCRCTVSTFHDSAGEGPAADERYVSGNRCERGGDPDRPRSTLPNLVDAKYRRLFRYRRLTSAQATRGDIGIPRALNMYENYPFWFTVLTDLGFRVLLSGRSSHTTLERGMESIASENICYPAKLVHGHIVDLVERGVGTVFYPAITYEQRIVPESDDHYNCPVVACYPEVIRANCEKLHTAGVRLLTPFLNLSKPDKLAERLAEIFAEDGVTPEEARRAVDAGYAEDRLYKQDIRDAGRRALEEMAERGVPGIVLAGRPYHVDPEVHHGIPELINSLGLAVLTEDSVLGESVTRPELEVRDQWAYHSRLYSAAAVVASRDDLHLVQLNSFGCGLDAVTIEQTADILRAGGDVGAVLKIDEVSNLGAARIRLRSLLAASRARERKRIALGGSGCMTPAACGAAAGVPRRHMFTKAMRRTHSLITPQMSPIHFALLEGAFAASGIRTEVLATVSEEDREMGLRYVNNDACYPAIIVVGQLVNAFVSGRYDPETTSVLISQSGGMCRATNYTALLRRGLHYAGFGHVPVAAVSPAGLERHPGLRLTPGLVRRALRAVVLGDLLQSLVLRVRPYESDPGSADALCRRWEETGREFLRGRGRRTVSGRRMRYPDLVEEIVLSFEGLPRRRVPRRTRVGVVGEILVTYHPDANNHVVDILEAEGFEAALPGLTEFVTSSMYTADWNNANLGTEGVTRHVKKVLRAMAAHEQKPVRRMLSRQDSLVSPPPLIPEMIERARPVVSLGNQAGEGWLLTADILNLVHEGVLDVLCVQPFGCLPNHVTGKGMFRQIRRCCPEANVASIDYDPGVSEVNQLNRIRLLLATGASHRMRHSNSS
jgi:predicted CoA-substrate-specific enzyme activase